MAIFQLCLLALLSVAFAEGSYVFFNQLSFLGGDFNVSYNFNASSDTLEFLVEVRATGWVGFGFAVNAPNSMTNYDVAVGGVFNGSGYLKDYFTQGFGQPPEDTQQDWTLKNATEMNGITALKFCRQRNTNDSKDVAIEPGMPIFLILAYHATADVSVGSFPKHTTRSSQQVILIPAVTTTMTPMAATSTSAMAVSMKTSVRTDAPVSDIPAVVGTSTTIATEMSSSTKGKSTTTTMDPSTASAIAPTMAASYVAASAVSVPPTSTPTAVSNFISLDGGKYNVSWMFNSTMDTFHFVVKVRATGWIGFGLATRAPNGMSGYDVAVSGTNNGTKYLKDYFTGGFAAPPQDAQQDWMLSYFSEEQSVTTLKFCRKRDTNDTENDIAIQPGQSYYFIWAYHISDTVTQGRFPKHSLSGSHQVGPLIPSIQPTSIATTESPVTASAVSVPPTSTPTAVSNFISLDGGKYNVSWMFNSTMDTFHFVVKVRATGWIGFGLATRAPNGMSGYDVAVSGTNNGTKYLKDYFTGGFAAPPQDAQQDWMLSYFSEEQNVTTLKFYRKRDTNDTENDIAIQPGQSYYFIWAYHISDTVTQGQFPKHSFSGSYQVGPLIPSIQPTTTATTESPTTPGTALPTQMPFPFAFDDNKFLARWRFDDQADKIHVHLRVKTTGWIGFGFAQTAPNNMRDYDVIVGGFSNGRGYLSDYKTFGRTTPTLDASQDYTLLNASEAGGYTQLIFERPRDTGDENDFAFMRGSEAFIVWSYSNADISDERNFGIHSSKGWSSEKYALVSENQPIPTEAKASALYSSFAIALSIAFFHVLL